MDSASILLTYFKAMKMSNKSLTHFTKKTIKLIFPQLWVEILLRVRKQHFEKELFLAQIFCNKKQIAIDIGANQGIYTYFMAKFAKKVISFEPNIRLQPALNRIAPKNVAVQMVALSDASGRTLMKIDPTNDGVSTIEQKNHFRGTKAGADIVEMEVTTDTLDSFKLSDVSFIKIDVEGHEEAVLRGAWNTIAQNLPVLIIESENRHNEGAPVRVSEMLGKLGYQGFFIKNDQLRSFGDLEASDIDVGSLARRMQYINNFIYVPVENISSLEQISQVVRTLR
jgi:FkbM family methyltransferase